MLLGIDSPRDFRLPEIRSMGGCIFVLSCVLYPYVYLTTRAMFMMQAANLIDVARIVPFRIDGWSWIEGEVQDDGAPFEILRRRDACVPVDEDVAVAEHLGREDRQMNEGFVAGHGVGGLTGALLTATEHLLFVQSRVAMLDIFLALFVFTIVLRPNFRLEALAIVEMAKEMINEVEALLPASSTPNFRERLVAHLERMKTFTGQDDIDVEFHRKAGALLGFYDQVFGVTDLVDGPEED